MRLLDRAHDLACQRELVAVPRLDVGQNADAAQQVLVHRIVVVHVELHHRDDAAEGAHEAPEHADLVHPPQHHLGAVAGEDLEEQVVRDLVLAQLLIDQLERALRGAHRFRMEGEIVLLGETEDADEVDGVAAEGVRIRDVDAIVVDDEILAVEHHAARARL